MLDAVLLALRCHLARVSLKQYTGEDEKRPLCMQSPRAHGALRHLNAFIQGPSLLRPPSASAAASVAPSGSLTGLSIAIKDNICTTDFPTTCGSRGLHGYQSPYDATVVTLLRQAGGHICGKTNLDEFGMG